MKNTIITKTATKPGKTVAIFGGVHGNEKIGVTLLTALQQSLVPSRGTIHLVYGNPRAIEQNVRFTETNLNRNFIREQQPTSYEAQRAQELMDLLDNCDALLDLHAYNEPDMQVPAFAICEAPAFAAVATLPVEVVLSGFTAIQRGGSNGYMEEQGKVGVVLELGSTQNPDRHAALAHACVQNFLQYFGVLPGALADVQTQEYLRVASVHRRNSETFAFAKDYASFDAVTTGEVIATDGALQLHAAQTGRLLFPRPNAPVGAEAFWFLESAA